MLLGSARWRGRGVRGTGKKEQALVSRDAALSGIASTPGVTRPQEEPAKSHIHTCGPETRLQVCPALATSLRPPEGPAGHPAPSMPGRAALTSPTESCSQLSPCALAPGPPQALPAPRGPVPLLSSSPGALLLAEGLLCLQAGPPSSTAFPSACRLASAMAPAAPRGRSPRTFGPAQPVSQGTRCTPAPRAPTPARSTAGKEGRAPGLASKDISRSCWRLPGAEDPLGPPSGAKGLR